MLPETPTRPVRVRPSPWIAACVVVAYIVVTFGLQLSSGLSYAEWTDSAAHLLRAVVLPLGAGAVVIIAFVWWSGWDLLWRDPGRLAMSRILYVAIGFFVFAIAVRFAATEWSQLGAAYLGAVLLAGVLVGFTEEMLFRGIVLRSLRDGVRSEGAAVLWTSVGFGLFHLPNLLVGVGPTQVVQIALAALTGVILYAFRRSNGLIVTAMVAHGIWDISTFTSGASSYSWLPAPSFLLVVAGVVIGVWALVAIWRTDRHTIVAPSGIVVDPS